MNFDFGKHWDTRIVPLLSTRQVKSCITQAINTYLKYECPWRTYDKKRAPADYVAGGAFYADPYAEYEAKILYYKGHDKTIQPRLHYVKNG